MSGQRETIKKVAMSLLACSLMSAPKALATDPTGDVFSHNLPTTAPAPTRSPAAQMIKDQDPNIGAGSLAMMSKDTPATRWFESFDRTQAMMMVKPEEKSILTRPFMQQAERVQEWTTVAGGVAKKYHLLAMTLHTMPVPSELAPVNQYKNQMADWYDDVACIYDDLIRPHAPARTQEELQAQLNAIAHRKDSLKAQGKALHEMDEALRKRYAVHLNENTDALQGYVKAKPHQ